jgi:hypothetical protein
MGDVFMRDKRYEDIEDILMRDNWRKDMRDVLMRVRR